MIKSLFLFLLLISTGASAFSNEFQKPQLFTLPDGLTLIVEEDHSAPIASVQVWCATGSIHEDTHLGSGLSHILEHMLFKGTTRRGPGVIAQEVRDQGGSINAATFYNKTCYVIETSSSGVTDAVDILADAMMNASLPLKEYKKEQEVIRREMAMDHDDPKRMSRELLFRTAFYRSPFCEPVVGHLDIYNQLTRDDVMTYYKQRYIPNNLCFIVVGDVDTEKLQRQLSTLFAKRPRQSLKPVLVQKEPLQVGKRIRRTVFPTSLSHMTVAWRVSDDTCHDFPALTLLAEVLGSGASSLLNQEVRENKKLVHQVGVALEQQGIFCISATADLQKRDAAEAEILQQIELVKKQGITAAELEKAKKRMLSGRLHTLSTISGRASDYGVSWVATGDPCFEQEYFEEIKHATPEQVKQVAQRYLVNDGLTITSLDPLLAKESAAKNNNSNASNVVAAEEKIRTNTIQKFTLPNGLRLLIHEDHRLPLISMEACFRGGLLIENANNNGLTSLLTSTITRGTHAKTGYQIAQALEQVGGSIRTNPADDSFGVFVEVMKPDLQLGLDLLSDVLLNATFPKSEVEKQKMNQLAAIKSEDDHVNVIARKLLQTKLFGPHPYAYRLLGTAASVSTLTPEMLQAFYKKLVVGRNGVLAVFGDVNTEEVLTMVTKAFASMPAGTEALQAMSSITPLTAPIKEQATHQSEQSVIMKGFLGGTFTGSDRLSLELLQRACSDMESRFFKQIRDKKALVYYVGSSNSMGLAPGSFVFYLATDPKKAALACHEMNREIDQLVTHGLTQEELDQAKKKILRSDAANNQSNDYLMRISAGEELMSLGYDHYQHRADEVNAVTLEQVNRVIKKYLGAPGSVEVEVGPSAPRSVLKQEKSEEP